MGPLQTEKVAAQSWVPGTWMGNRFCDDNKGTSTDLELYLFLIEIYVKASLTR